MFTDEFLDNLPEDPLEAAVKLCDKFKVKKKAIPKGAIPNHYEEFLQAYAVLRPFAEMLGVRIDTIQPGKNRPNDINIVIAAFFRVGKHIEQGQLEQTFAAMQRKYQNRFGAGFMYEFSDGDLKRIQDLINELRDAITASKLFDEKHKQRILKKLEKLQAELHKKMGSIAQIYELIGEFGVVLGKFGEDAKPFTDRIMEIVQIGWRAEARAQELPSGLQFPRLPDGKGKGDNE